MDVMQVIYSQYLDIKWLKLEKRPRGNRKRHRKIDIVEKDGKMTGKEFLQKCQLLEDVETSMYHNRKDMVNSNIKYRYSKDELLKLRTHPLSNKPPSLQENLKFLLGTSKSKEREEIDLKKNLVKKHGLTRNLDGAVNEKYDLKKNDNPRNGEKSIIGRSEGIEDTRKPADPKERIRKEQDICLSPQRKSFTTGCYVANIKNDAANNSNAPNNNKTNNENVGRENRDPRDTRDSRDVRDPREMRDSREMREMRDGREMRDMRDNRDNRDNKNFREGSRRIGSGRIISRDPRFEIRGYPDSDYSRSSYYGKEKIPTVVYERKFPANSDKEKDNKFWDRQRTFNYYDKRRSHDNRDDEEEEPEWMKEGPVSLDDVIELKGFDENDERPFRFNRNSKINTRVFHHKSFTNNSNNRSPTSGNPKNRMEKRNSDSDNSSVASDSLASKLDDNDSSNKPNDDETDKQKTGENLRKKEGTDVKNVENSMHFNLEEILKLDPLPDISENVDHESAGSKFTRWFKRDDALSSNVINNEQIPGVPKAGLIPFSSNLPGEMARAQNIAGSSIHASNNQSSGSNLLELLRGSQENNANPRTEMRALEATGKLHSVEEIEAKLRGTDNNSSSNPNSPNDKKKKEEETEAFKKLLSQAFQFDKNCNEGNSPDMGFSQKFERGDNGDGKVDLATTLCNGENQANPSINVQPQMSRLPPQMNNMQQTAEKLKFLQMQQNKQQQEILSKVLMSSSPSTTFSVPPPTSNVRPSNVAPNNGPFIHVAQEIQNMISAVQPTRELMQRPETVNILRALRSGEVSHYQLIEQLKKLTPYQAKFRESLLCVLKLIQTPYCNSAPVLGSPAAIPFNVVHPPSISSAQPYTENIIQQMMLNSQYRVNGPQPHNGMSNIVYQRDFPSPNQNMYPNTPIKKHLVEQSPNIGQNVPRMNSPTSILSSPVSVSASGSNLTNATNSIVLSQDDVNKTPSTTQSLSFTPTSVLRKLSAEKENLDTFSKEAKDSKGEKNTLIPYTSNANNSSSICSNQGTVDHFNGFGTCIPPPAISGQYFVGNMIRPASISTQVPIFGNPPPPVLSRLPVPSNSSTVPRDASISLVGFGNQNVSSRNTPMNGTLSSAEEQMARWFSSDGVNQSRYVMAQSMGVPGASLQNMMSVEEIERVQQSVRN